MRLGVLLLSIVFIIGGGQSLYTSFKDRRPTEVSLESLADKKPEAKWLKIKGGSLDTISAAYFSAFGAGKAKSVYVPLVLEETDPRGEPIHVLVLTEDPKLVKFTNEVRELDKEGTPVTKIHEFMLANKDKLRVPRTVQGLVQFGMDSDDRKEQKLRNLFPNLTDDVIIIEEGKKPSMAAGFGSLGAGILIGAIGVLLKNRKSGSATPPPLPPQGGSSTPPAMPG